MKTGMVAQVTIPGVAMNHRFPVWRFHRKNLYYRTMMRSAILFLPVILLCSTVFADQVDDYLKDQMAKHRIPGIALRIIQNGQPVKTGTYGLANIELNVPVKDETVFEIGSVTKQFTAAGILLLAEGGKLSVDDLITAHKKTPLLRGQILPCDIPFRTRRVSRATQV